MSLPGLYVVFTMSLTGLWQKFTRSIHPAQKEE